MVTAAYYKGFGGDVTIFPGIFSQLTHGTRSGRRHLSSN